MTAKEGFPSIREALLFCYIGLYSSQQLFTGFTVSTVKKAYLTTNSTLEAMGDTFPSAVRQRTSSL